jgi:hypothetical protein
MLRSSHLNEAHIAGVLATKQSSMGWAGHVERIGHTRNANKALSAICEWRRPLCLAAVEFILHVRPTLTDTCLES